MQCCDSQGHVQISNHGTSGPWHSLDEPYIFENSAWDPRSKPGKLASGSSDQRSFGPVTIPKGRLWVMGDHRGDSADSRYHCIEQAPTNHDCGTATTTVSVSKVIGKGVLIAWPPSRWRTLGTPARSSRRRTRRCRPSVGPPLCCRCSRSAVAAVASSGGRRAARRRPGPARRSRRAGAADPRASGGRSRQHWLAPGGGTKPGETPRDAAIREAYEQTGIRVELAPDAAEVMTSQRRWAWDGVTYDQTDHLFHAGVGTGSVSSLSR